MPRLKSRIDQVANPDVSQFNIAMPSKARLSIFESYCRIHERIHLGMLAEKLGGGMWFWPALLLDRKSVV